MVSEPSFVINLLPFGENAQDLNLSTSPPKNTASFFSTMLSTVSSFPYKTNVSSGAKVQQEMRLYSVEYCHNLISSGKLKTQMIPLFNTTAANFLLEETPTATMGEWKVLVPSGFKGFIPVELRFTQRGDFFAKIISAIFLSSSVKQPSGE